MLAFTRPDEVQPAKLARLAKAVPTWLAGAGASEQLAKKAGARLLAEDPVAAAERVAPL